MRDRALSGPVPRLLTDAGETRFADQAAWQAHLERLGITAMKVQPDPVRIATEGALWGSVKAHGLLRDTVIVSDDARQFNVGQHGLCWIHAERLVHKLDTFTENGRSLQHRMRRLIWRYYEALKAYQSNPGAKRRAALRARFDRIFRRRTGFAALDRLLARRHANKAELLMVLDRPEIPLHTNGSENDIRAVVTRRKISGAHPQRRRAGLPRRLPVAAQDLRQAGHRLLGLSRRQTCHRRRPSGPPPAATRPAAPIQTLTEHPTQRAPRAATPTAIRQTRRQGPGFAPVANGAYECALRRFSTRITPIKYLIINTFMWRH